MIEFTSDKPKVEGFFIADLGTDLTVGRTWFDKDDVLQIAFVGKARGKRVDALDYMFPDAKFSRIEMGGPDPAADEPDRVSPLFDTITTSNGMSEVLATVDEAKSEYVHDWEDEFDNIDEAYAEQGRGEAESQVINGLIPTSVVVDSLGEDEKYELINRLADHYGLSLD